MTSSQPLIHAVSLKTDHNGQSTKLNDLGMRPMQARAFAKRGEQYLLIKSPPASGKSRALMFIALDKLRNQDIKKTFIIVPERSIGGSFADEPLSQFGFESDWHVPPQWNLCNAMGADDDRVAKSKVKAVGEFLESDDQIMVCTHATFRFAVDEYGLEAFDQSLLAVDEFHHVSANPKNKLGSHLNDFINRDKVHIVAMTGSYFRGDTDAVLSAENEEKFATVTYTYYEQLNGYDYLKELDIDYYFYDGSYIDNLGDVLDVTKKTIIHIPNVNSRESTKDKHNEVNEICQILGQWQGTDEKTGFHLIKTEEGKILKIADLVEDDPDKRNKVITALKDPAHKYDRDHVNIIIALGMAKEGFDWIWCDNALTVGYRSSLTEIIQIIGRATRDAPGKTVARFINMVAEPQNEQGHVVEAVNDFLKAISASLLMEQILAPRYEFTPKTEKSGPLPDYDYGEEGYQKDKTNIGYNAKTGQIHAEIKGLKPLITAEGKRAQQDLPDLCTHLMQDKKAILAGNQEDVNAKEITIGEVDHLIGERYPDLPRSEQEALGQHLNAQINLTQQINNRIQETQTPLKDEEDGEKENSDGTQKIDEAPISQASTVFVEAARQLMNVKNLDIDMIESINPFGAAYKVLSKGLNEKTLKEVENVINTTKLDISFNEAEELTRRALEFKRQYGVLPRRDSENSWERRMAEGVAKYRYFAKKKKAQEAKDEGEE